MTEEPWAWAVIVGLVLVLVSLHAAAIRRWGWRGLLFSLGMTLLAGTAGYGTSMAVQTAIATGF